MEKRLVIRYNNLKIRFTAAELIGPSKDYDEEREQFRIREDILHPRRPFDIPAIYES